MTRTCIRSLMLHRQAAVLLLASLSSWLLAPAMARADEYRFSVEPEYPVAQAEEVYAPLMAHLSAATGHTFILVVPRNYHLLWRDMRNATPVDFVFEDAHFTDYRAQRLGYTPLARVATPTTFSLIAMPEVAERGLEGLVGYRVVSMPSPSLGYAALGNFYPNPISQPDVQSVAATWRDGVEMVFAGEAEAAMVPKYIADLYPNLSLIGETPPYPGRAVSAASTVPAEVVAAVRTALLAMHEDQSLYTALNEIGALQFEPVDSREYRGRQTLLRGFIGYQER
ncbi:MAG TPA: hypothetical protein DDZ76_08420 [Xanthomonadales bacterium]|nr:hypothetical protein [Xanthomonadales bacterium]